jgi:hypothetical protein
MIRALTIVDMLTGCRRRPMCGRAIAAKTPSIRWNVAPLSSANPKTIRVDNGPEFVREELDL